MRGVPRHSRCRLAAFNCRSGLALDLPQRGRAVSKRLAPSCRADEAAGQARRLPGARSSGRERSLPPCGLASAAGVGAALPEAGAARTRPTHAQQQAEAALLSIIEAVVERLGCVGELRE